MLTIFKYKDFTVRYWFNTNKTLKIYNKQCRIDKMECNINEYQKSYSFKDISIVVYICVDEKGKNK